MRVVFAGSLDKSNQHLNIIISNLKSLVLSLLNSGHDLLIRDSPVENDRRLIIDNIIYEAYCEYINERKAIKENLLIVFVDSNNKTMNEYRHATIHQSTHLSRMNFYKEMISLVDLVIGVGGELGLMRLYMVCEWNSHPFIILPGAGDISDFIWGDFIAKSYKLNLLSKEKINILKQIPYITNNGTNYSIDVKNRICSIYDFLKKERKYEHIINVNNITIQTLFTYIKRFSIGLWGWIIAFFSIYTSIVYNIGEKKLLVNFLSIFQK